VAIGRAVLGSAGGVLLGSTRLADDFARTRTTSRRFPPTTRYSMGSVIKKRRKRMAKKKHRKLLRKTRHQRRNKK
jgi:Mitochondrial domain of unknown function (DUF1713)